MNMTDIESIFSIIKPIIIFIIATIIVPRCCENIITDTNDTYERVKKMYATNTYKSASTDIISQSEMITVYESNTNKTNTESEIELQSERHEYNSISTNNGYNQYNINKINIQDDCEITYPSFLTNKTDSQNGYIELSNSDSSISLLACKDSYTMTAKDMYDTIIDVITAESDNTITYKVCYSDRFYISGFKSDGSVFYRHTRIYKGDSYTWILNYDKDHYDTGINILNKNIIQFNFNPLTTKL